jgi:hypothetical protein
MSLGMERFKKPAQSETLGRTIPWLTESKTEIPVETEPRIAAQYRQEIERQVIHPARSVVVDPYKVLTEQDSVKCEFRRQFSAGV